MARNGRSALAANSDARLSSETLVGVYIRCGSGFMPRLVAVSPSGRGMKLLLQFVGENKMYHDRNHPPVAAGVPGRVRAANVAGGWKHLLIFVCTALSL